VILRRNATASVDSAVYNHNSDTAVGLHYSLDEVQWRQQRHYYVTASYWRYTYCEQTLS